MKKHPHYEIHLTEDGRVFKNGRWAKLSIRPDGYAVVSVGGRGEPVRRLCRLMLETFVGPCPDGMDCRHKDSNPGNNHILNLAWGTRYEQIQDQKDRGTFSPPPIGANNKGPEFAAALIAAKDEYESGAGTSRAIAAKHGVSKTHLLRAVNRELKGGGGHA